MESLIVSNNEEEENLITKLDTLTKQCRELSSKFSSDVLVNK